MATTDQPSPEDVTEESLISSLKERRGARCSRCQGAVCHHQMLMSVYMGFKNAPRCLPCLANSLEIPPAELRDRLIEAIRGRDCYRAAWEWASREEGFDPELPPSCLLE